MPLYEYRCEHCGIRFEKLVRRADHTEPVACPCCGGTETQRQFSAFARLGGSRSGGQSCAVGGGG